MKSDPLRSVDSPIKSNLEGYSKATTAAAVTASTVTASAVTASGDANFQPMESPSTEANTLTTAIPVAASDEYPKVRNLNFPRKKFCVLIGCCNHVIMIPEEILKASAL